MGRKVPICTCRRYTCSGGWLRGLPSAGSALNFLPYLFSSSKCPHLANKGGTEGIRQHLADENILGDHFDSLVGAAGEGSFESAFELLEVFEEGGLG